MQSAKALQIKGLSGGNSEEKISEFASYLAQQQQQQLQQQYQQQPPPQQLQQQQLQPQQLQPQLPLIPQPMVATAAPFVAAVPNRQKRNSLDDARNGGKKRRSKNPEEQADMGMVCTTADLQPLSSVNDLKN
jgi:hypothetical protein